MFCNWLTEMRDGNTNKAVYTGIGETWKEANVYEITMMPFNPITKFFNAANLKALCINKEAFSDESSIQMILLRAV